MLRIVIKQEQAGRPGGVGLPGYSTLSVPYVCSQAVCCGMQIITPNYKDTGFH